MNSFQKACRLYLNDIITYLPIDYGEKKYTKFIILGRSRVGSNMLRSMLNKHPQIISYGELFRSMGEVGWGIRYYWPNRINFFNEDVYLKNKPIDFLNTRIFKKYDKEINAVGFKLFYYHAQQENWKKVWKHLKNNNFKIIHLKRKNLLRVHISRQLAEKTGAWKNRKYAKSIRLDPALCEKDFQRTEVWWKEAEEFFNKNSVLELWYEDLVKDRQVWVNKILNFLEIENTSLNLEPLTKKQASQKASKTITNFDELKEYFSDTKWEYLFKL